MASGPQDSPLGVPGTAYPGASLLVLRDAWIDWTKGKDWRWFCTLTFARDQSERAADKAFRRWHRAVSRAALGVRRSWHESRGVPMLRASERTTSDRIHYHVLAGPTGRLGFRDLSGAWEINGFARCYPFQLARGAERYCAKYVVKGSELLPVGDWLTWGGQRGKLLLTMPQDAPARQRTSNSSRPREDNVPIIPEPYLTDTLRYWLSKSDRGWLLPCQ